MVFAGVGLVAYIGLVGAFAIPGLFSGDDVAASEEPSSTLTEEYTQTLAEHDALAVELATAQCEADAVTATAGALLLRAEEVTDDVEPLAVDTSLLRFENKTQLLAAIATARDGLAALDVPAEQRSLAESFNPEACATAAEEASAESSEEPTDEHLAALQERIAAMTEELDDVAPLGVSIEDVAAVIAPLEAPAIAAAQNRTLVQYYLNALAAGSAETMESFAEASGQLDDAVSASLEQSTPEATLTMVARLIDTADGSNRVIQEHNDALQSPTQEPAPVQPGPTQPPSTPAPSAPSPSDPGPSDPAPSPGPSTPPSATPAPPVPTDPPDDDETPGTDNSKN